MCYSNLTILIGCGLHVQCSSYIHFEDVCDCCLMLSKKSASIVMTEQVTFQWDDDDDDDDEDEDDEDEDEDEDDDIRFVLDQNAGFVCSANLLKQLPIYRQVAPLWHIIRTPNQLGFCFRSLCCMLREQIIIV